MTRLGSLTRAVLQDRGDARWLIQRHARTAYLGWTNRGNVGDEAMWLAFTNAPALKGLRRAPIQRAGRLMATGARCDVLIIGGGTLLGRPEWLTRFEEARRRLRPARVMVLGTGVEDAGFGAARGTTSSALMERTAQFLYTCDYVGVRGPRSQSTLGALGLRAEVVGDPALCLRPPNGAERDRPGLRRVAINLSAAGGIEAAPGSTRKELAHAARLLGNAGWDVTFFGMERSDQLLAESVVGDRFAVLPWAPDPRRVIDLLDRMELVISERLHGGILAAARGVPFLQLGYKPKVHDFAESVGAQDYVVDPLALDAEDLVSRVEALTAEGRPPTGLRSRVTAMADRFESTLDDLLQDGKAHS
jgi:polysaccharide pyruvyl transferase WcaK-like protein